MSKAILIKTGNGIEHPRCLFPNDEGKVYLNLSFVFSFSFHENRIDLTFSDDTEVPHSIGFDTSSMGEYHRIKREIKEFMNITE